MTCRSGESLGTEKISPQHGERSCCLNGAAHCSAFFDGPEQLWSCFYGWMMCDHPSFHRVSFLVEQKSVNSVMFRYYVEVLYLFSFYVVCIGKSVQLTVAIISY